MKIFRYIHLIIFLWFSNEVKASLSVDFDLINTYSFVKTLSAENLNKLVQFPFSSKEIFRTFYNFNLGLMQSIVISIGRRGEDISEGGKKPIFPLFKSVSTFNNYICKNENISFIPIFSLFISKRETIKKISRRVDLYFDFYIPLQLSLFVALLTKDGENLKFFHAPECANKDDEKKRGMPFGVKILYGAFSRQNFLMKFCGYSKETVKESYEQIDSIDKIFSFLYCFASWFRFCFDITICSYLLCYISVPISNVFCFFCPFRYLSLKNECMLYKDENDWKKKELERRRNNLLEVMSIKNLLSELISLFYFSIKFFDEN